MEFSPDYRKHLHVLHDEWRNCTKCALGENRDSVGGKFVAGEGEPGGIMFIGEGPGRDEEAKGRPFIGNSGKLLRGTIAKLGLDRVYITNIVACRSCAPDYDNEGKPRIRFDRSLGINVQVIKDCPPATAHIKACLPRIYEEIYLVDPKLIVALGEPAATTLAKHTVRIQQESGTLIQIAVPGAGRKPVLTEKKQAWARKIRGVLVMPHQQSEVFYPMIPLLHPSFVLRKHSDERWLNPVQVFCDGMLRAAQIYDRLMFEVYGDRSVPERTLNQDDVQTIIEYG